MHPLPIANAEVTRFFHQWLEAFAGYVREVDYASARPLFHPEVLAFEAGEPGGVNCTTRNDSPTAKSASSLQPRRL
jgi:hypothetical protein